MLVLGINVLAHDDPSEIACAAGAFMESKVDAILPGVIFFYDAAGGTFQEAFSLLGLQHVMIMSVNIPLAPFDVDVLSLVVSKGQKTESYFLDQRSVIFGLVQRGVQIDQVYKKSQFSCEESPDDLYFLMKGALALLSDIENSVFATDLREALIRLEAVFSFAERRSCYGACVSLGDAFALSGSLREALGFAKTLEVSGASAYQDIALSVKHLRKADTIYRALMQCEGDSSWRTIFRKANIWAASFYLAQAHFLSRRRGYMNESVHLCVRALESYLTGLSVWDNKAQFTSGALRVGGNKVMGARQVVGLSRIVAPQSIHDLIDRRNRSELAHGANRWGSQVSQTAVSDVKDFIHSLESTLPDLDREFFLHYREATSLDFGKLFHEVIEGFLANCGKHIDGYAV